MSFFDKLFGKKKPIDKIIEIPQVVAVEKRARAYDPGFTTWDMGQNRDLAPSTSGRYNMLAWTELESIYQKTSVIKAIVDGIVRIVSSLDWRIVSNDPNNSTTSSRIRNKIWNATEFFKNPNANDESFNCLRKKLVRDLLIFDACVVEKVFTNSGVLQEIIAQDPKYFHIMFDNKGYVYGYEQRYATNKVVIFKPEEIIYMVLNPSSSSHYGYPVMDALSNEIASVMLSTQLIAKISEYDQIPPGLLNLGKIGQVAYDRAREYFSEKASGGKSQYEMPIVHDTDKVEWIPLTKSPKDLQLTELLDKVNRMIFRCFGITPTEMGSIEDVNRATAQVQENIGNSKLIRPISLLLKNYFDSEIIWPHFSTEISIEFAKPKEDDLSNILKIAALQEKGVVSINAIRHSLNLDPIKGGDGHYVYHPNLPFGAINVEDMDEQLKFLNANFRNSANVDNKLKPYMQDTKEENNDKENEDKEDKDMDVSEKKKEVKKQLHEVIDNSKGWFIPSIIQAVAYKKDKPSNVINRLFDHLYSKMKVVLDKNDIKINLDNALLSKSREIVLKDVKYLSNSNTNTSPIKWSKNMTFDLNSNTFNEIINLTDIMIDNIYETREVR